jgi:hypothetical protein
LYRSFRELEEFSARLSGKATRRVLADLFFSRVPSYVQVSCSQARPLPLRSRAALVRTSARPPLLLPVVSASSG